MLDQRPARPWRRSTLATKTKKKAQEGQNWVPGEKRTAFCPSEHLLMLFSDEVPTPPYEKHDSCEIETRTASQRLLRHNRGTWDEKEQRTNKVAISCLPSVSSAFRALRPPPQRTGSTRSERRKYHLLRNQSTPKPRQARGLHLLWAAAPQGVCLLPPAQGGLRKRFVINKYCRPVAFFLLRYWGLGTSRAARKHCDVDTASVQHVRINLWRGNKISLATKQCLCNRRCVQPEAMIGCTPVTCRVTWYRDNR